MRASWILAVLGLASLGVLGEFCLLSFHKEQTLKIEAAQVKERGLKRSQLGSANARMARELAKFGDLTVLWRNHNQAQQIQSGIDKLRLTIHNLQLAKPLPGESKPDPVWPDGAEVKAAKDWAYVGKKTPRDMLESLLWASTNGDVDHLAGLITFHGPAQAAAQALFDQLPDKERADYGSPAKIVAEMIAASMPTDLEAASIDAKTWKWSLLTVRDEHADGAQSDMYFRADQSADGWQLDVPAKVIQGFQKKLSDP